MSIKRFLGISLTVAASAVSVACLDIPHSPNTDGKIKTVDVYVRQFGESKSEPLKVSSKDSASLIASVSPDTYRDDVRYYWYNDDELMDSGRTYSIPIEFMQSSYISKNFIPNHLSIVDDEGNEMGTEFHVIVNEPPELSSRTIPADGDTLYGNSATPMLFRWYIYDNSDIDTLQSFLEIDGISYPVGGLTLIQQSGFDEGVHTFRIIVQDSYGDMDSTELKEFFVIDTLGDT